MKDQHNPLIPQLHATPSTTLTELLRDNEDQQWYLDEIAQGGPDHKKALSALLLEAADKLVTAVADKTGQSFSARPGTALTKDYSTGAHPFPVALPATNLTDKSSDLATLVQAAPDHELLAYLTAIQAMSWAAETMR